MRNDKPKMEYDIALKSRALTSFTMRVAVACYIVYLAWKLLSGTQKGASAIPAWGVGLICIVFAAAALAFCFYAWRQYKKALKAAQIQTPQNTETADGEISNPGE